MSFQTAVFYLFAAILVFAALRVISVKSPVHAALWLVLSFFTAAAIWLLLGAEFLAITLVLVYVGAVMVLFLFVVMMLDINLDQVRQGFWRNLPVALFVGVAIVIELAIVLMTSFHDRQGDVPALPADYSNTKALGRLIYTEYVYAFEIAAVVLLVAIVAAIALTLRRRKETHYQDPSVQLAATKAGRLKIVKDEPAGSRNEPAEKQ